MYLQTDLKGSTAKTEQLIGLPKASNFCGDFTGNGHCLDLRDNLVVIEAMLDEEAPDPMLSFGDRLVQVQAWLRFISTPIK